MNLKFDLYKFTRIEASGIPVLFKKIPWASGYAYIHVIVGTGARSDPAGKEGIAHFFEHLPFNGCEGYSTSEATEEVDRRLFGGTLNAHTGMEYTIFHGKVAVERISEA
ncbi:MAG TPA: insulinase family protein, partial [Candidatus Paceibacterota bacterium]|nr:insulinase family protein [Candidatus Paceibacterota bacterium]